MVHALNWCTTLKRCGRKALKQKKPPVGGFSVLDSSRPTSFLLSEPQAFVVHWALPFQ